MRKSIIEGDIEERSLRINNILIWVKRNKNIDFSAGDMKNLNVSIEFDKTEFQEVIKKIERG